jgi:hypothetical protein
VSVTLRTGELVQILRFQGAEYHDYGFLYVTPCRLNRSEGTKPLRDVTSQDTGREANPSNTKTDMTYI